MTSRRPSRLVLVSLSATAAVIVGGVALQSPDEPDVQPRTAPSSVSPRDLRTTAVVPRERLCAKIPDQAITAAVGGAAVAKEYLPEADVQYTPGRTDLVAEFGCSFRRVSAVARAWVFATPVDTQEARSLTEARLPGKCRELTAYNYGRPGRAQACADKRFRTFTASGKFGDAWLTCQLEWPKPVAPVQVRARGQAWCNDVLRGAANPS